jgi:hypothetical protein
LGRWRNPRGLMWTWKHFWWKPWVRDLTPTWGKSSHPGIPIYLGAMHECQFVMGWSLKMRHACDFMVIEHIGSLMNMSYWNLISWRHDMALFCFRHGQLQMREGLQSPWGQSAQSDEWMNSRTWSRRRHEFRLGGLVQCWPSVTLVKNCYSVSKYFLKLLEVSLKMKNPSMSHNMSLVRFTNSLTSSCLASVSHGSLPMTCSICSWIVMFQ